MLFNSVEFFVFLAVVYTLYRVLTLRWQNLMLLASSLLFYGWWDERFLFLIILSASLDYAAALLMREGFLRVRDRLFPSLTVIAAALFFVTADWQAAQSSPGRWPAHIQLSRLFPAWGQGWWAMGGAVAAVMAANLAYPWIVRLRETSRRRLLMLTSIGVNLGILGFFKYFNFFVDSANAALHEAGMNPVPLRLSIILPVGISFYTFQTMSYVIDVYRGELAPARRLWDHLLFVSYFPQLVAGPIERASHLLPMLMRPRQLTLDQSLAGCYLILLGLMKKVAIADGVAASVNAVYGDGAAASGLDVMAATALFAVQVYCDFSGYSDIARGTSKLLGIDLMVNFNLPYFSQNPSEFWRRWHISLSTWLRDYLYVPLGGNRYGPSSTYRNLMLTMLLGGLWHGANWNFVLWGFYQGALLCAHRLWTELRGGANRDTEVRRQGARPRALVALTDAAAVPVAVEMAGVSAQTSVTVLHEQAVVRSAGSVEHLVAREPRGRRGIGDFLQGLVLTGVFFVATCYGWLLFRAGSMTQIASFTRKLVLDLGDLDLSMPMPRLAVLAGLPLLVLMEIIEYRSGSSEHYRCWPRPVRGLLYAAMVVAILLGTSNAPAQFIYFQF